MENRKHVTEHTAYIFGNSIREVNEKVDKFIGHTREVCYKKNDMFDTTGVKIERLDASDYEATITYTITTILQ